jgi:hypothetical protein
MRPLHYNCSLAQPRLTVTAGPTGKKITGNHDHSDCTYNYHGKRPLPKFVVNLTDYTTDGASCSADVTQEQEDLGRPTLETKPDAVNKEFDQLTKQLKTGGYVDSTVP